MENTFGEPKGLERIGFSLVENGTDSLKKAHTCIEKLDGLIQGADHNLKDAVIFLNHGIEILLKAILSKNSLALVFDNIKDYQKAKIEMARTGKKDVFEINPNLKTVSLTEALIRIEYLCDIEVNDKMKGAVLELNKIRNELMHFSLVLEINEVKTLTSKLEFCYNSVSDFFEEHIKRFSEYIDVARFEFTFEEYFQEKADWQAEYMMEEYKLGID